MSEQLETVRKVLRGYADAHQLAAEKSAGSIASDWETDVAAQFGTVADLLDRALRTAPTTGVLTFADAGAWVWPGDEA